MIYQLRSTKTQNIENLKNRWADNDLSPFGFYEKYFKRYSEMDYDYFLEILNVHEMVTVELEKAINDFWEDTK